MIGRITGIIMEKQPPVVLVDVGGVGYEVEASMTTFCQLPAEGEKVVLFTHLVVREDAHNLFGFATAGERDLFRLLLKVNGVGAKLALTILSGMPVQQFEACVMNNDAAALTRLPGVGKKTAQRLLIEIRDRLPQWQASKSALAPVNAAPSPRQEAVSAMVALGYKMADADRLVTSIYDEQLSREQLIRLALQASMKRNDKATET